jgi:hypothetical protein
MVPFDSAFNHFYLVPGNLKGYEGELGFGCSDSVSATYVLLPFCDSCRSSVSVPAVCQDLSSHGSGLKCGSN